MAVAHYVTDTDAATMQLRTNVGLLVAIADSVYTVTDEATCRRASIARELLRKTPDTNNLAPVLVTKAGSLRYVITDGELQGGRRASYVSDTAFTILGAIAQ